VSAVSHLRLLQDPEILGEILHSLSQPLTTLCCSLELSIEKAAGQQQEAVSAALEQAERVISQVRLLREYLDAELIIPAGQAVAFTPVLRAVVEQLSSVAAVKQVGLQLVGTSSATIAVAESRLRLALQYLLGTMIEGHPANSEITLRLEERTAESLLHGEVESGSGALMDHPSGILEQHDEARISSRKVRLAIASRVLESSGASLTLGGSAASAFLLRIPRPSSRPV
jgi:hypothetical protein